jgi:hypothetical protein
MLGGTLSELRRHALSLSTCTLSHSPLTSK